MCDPHLSWFCVCRTARPCGSLLVCSTLENHDKAASLFQCLYLFCGPVRFGSAAHCRLHCSWRRRGMRRALVVLPSCSARWQVPSQDRRDPAAMHVPGRRAPGVGVRWCPAQAGYACAHLARPRKRGTPTEKPVGVLMSVGMPNSKQNPAEPAAGVILLFIKYNHPHVQITSVNFSRFWHWRSPFLDVAS